MLARAALLEAPAQTLRRVWPGAATCVLIGLAASFVAALHNGPPMLYALLFGTAFHYQSTDTRTAPGVDFCSRTLLRLGVGLLGARITLEQIAGLGGVTAGVVLAAVASTLLCGWLVGRLLRLPWTLGVLAGGATAICGASAALAIAAVLPRAKAGEVSLERQTLVVVVMATLLSTLAMVAYPVIARALHLSPALAGLFIGGSIHDVAQVVVAGYTLGTAVGDTASVVKLLRVSLLVVVVLGISLACRRAGEGPSRPVAQRVAGLVPGFLWLFAALAALNSLGFLRPVQEALNQASRACLMLGVAGLGMKTSFPHLASAGWRPVLLMLTTTAWIALVLLGAAWGLG
ncbi:MAG: putative sulfate exporter family transporter [Rhizobacter sp.]|nr:putative sulfate exporter family transporter [Rhizobacter sp.]